ncbi:MAG: hydantoinase B/oxoprolinase family protein [Nitrososphaerales archaeon]
MVDIITAEVIRGALTYTAEEMGITLRNAAYSPNIKERMDHSCAIFDKKARLLAQAEHIPVHLGSLVYGVKEGLKKIGELEEGDMIAYNDPYISGTHLPDLTLVAPIFYKGEIVAYVANKAHHSDIGGKVPGSMPINSKELFEEGLVLPPLKILEKGKIKDEILQIIERNVRTPKVTLGDLRAQIASNHLGNRRVLELMDRYGYEKFLEASDYIMDRSELLLKSRIEKLPKGSWEAEDYMESTGVEEKRMKIKVRIDVYKDEISFDYEGTHDQVKAPINAVYGVTLAGIYYTLKCVIEPELDINDGAFRPIKIKVPLGSLLNPIPPAPVALGNVETSQRNVDVLMRAFSKFLPDKVCAACQGTMNNLLIGGYDDIRKKFWTFYETIGGGYGARKGLDGVDGVQCHMTNTMNTPIEVIESEFPLIVTRYKLRANSGGAGKWRGGMGIERAFKLIAREATVTFIAERHKIRPWGLFGGKEGAPGELYLIKRGKKVRLKGKCSIKMERGDEIVIKTPGGGGYGEPKERDKKFLLKDLEDGLISRIKFNPNS